MMTLRAKRCKCHDEEWGDCPSMEDRQERVQAVADTLTRPLTPPSDPIVERAAEAIYECDYRYGSGLPWAEVPKAKRKLYRRRARAAREALAPEDTRTLRDLREKLHFARGEGRNVVFIRVEDLAYTLELLGDAPHE